MCETIKILKIAEVQKKACIFLVMLAMLLPTVTVYGHDDNERTSGKSEKTGPSLDAARAYIISEDFSKAVSAYAVLLQKDSIPP
jgi:hypothetical protein